MSAIQRFMNGFGFIFQGTRAIFVVPGIIPWAIIPFIIVFLAIAVGISFGMDLVGSGVGMAVAYFISPDMGFWYSLLYYPLFALFGVGFVALYTYFMFLMTSVVASPFNAILAEKVLIYEGVIEDPKMGIAAWIMLSLKMLGVSLVRALIFICLGLIIFLLSFIPVVNLAASFLAFLVIAFDSMDYSLEARRWSLKKRFQYFKENFLEFSGMATFLGLTLLVPGLTLLTLPSSVVGAAKVMSHREKLNESKRSTSAHL